MLEKFFVKEIVAPIIIIVVSVVIYFILKKIIKKIFKIKTLRHADAKRVNTVLSLFLNTLKFFIIVIALIYILDVYGIDTKSILASLGVFTAVMALALQDLLKDFVSGISIIIEGQYRIGDIVTIGVFKGEVISLSLKSTRVKASTGEVKIFSNRNITEVINHTLDKSLAVVDVSVAYDSDLDKVESTLKNLCLKLSKEIENIEGQIEVLGVNELGNLGIVYRLTVCTTANHQAEIQRKILRAMKQEFDDNGIVIAHS